MHLLLTGIAIFIITVLPCRAQGSAETPVRYRASFKTPTDSLRVLALLTKADSASVESLASAHALGKEAYDIVLSNIANADHPLADSCLTIIAVMSIYDERVEEGLQLMDSALAMSNRLYPAGHPLMIDQYYHRASGRESSGDVPGAMEDMKRSLAQLSALGMTDSAGFSYVYWYRGWLSLSMGDLPAAEPFFARSLELKRRELPPDSPELGQFLYQIGWFYQNAVNRDRAGELFSEALDIFRNDSTVETGMLLECMQSAASHYVTTGKYNNAAELYEEAENIYRTLPERDDATFANFLRQKGDFLASYGRYDEGEKLLFESYDIYTVIGPEANESKLYALLSIAAYYNKRGMNAEAEPWLLDAIDFARSVHGSEAMEYGMAVNNLGSFYLDRGRYAEALPLFEEASTVLEAAGPVWRKIGTTAISNMAIAYDYLGNTAKAEALYTTAYDRVLEDTPELDANRALAENNFGSFYLDRDAYAKAEPYIRRATGLYRLIYTEKPHPHLATAVNNQAKLFARIGRKDSAALLFEEALQLRRALFALPHPDLLNSLWHSGEFLSEQGQVEEASRMFEELIEGLARRMNESFAFESEGSQLDFMKNILQPGLDAFSRFCLAHGSDDAQLPGMFLDALLKLKGAVANESARRSAELQKNKQALQLSASLTTLREQQAALASRQNSPEVATERNALRRRADSADAALRKLDSEYDKLLKQREAGWKDVQRVLKPGEALVEFSAVPERAGSKRTERMPYHYGAVVLRHSGDPELLRVCAESALRPFLAAPVVPANQESYAINPERASELYGILWAPMQHALEGVSRVYISADGLLYRVAFSALCTDTDTRSYLEDAYDIHYVAGGRQLLERDVRYSVRRERANRRFTLVGNPDFAAVITPVPDSDGGRRYRSGWDALPGTGQEITAIARMCEQRNIPMEAITGQAAREDTIKALSNNPPRALHIATHGFFFPAVERASAAEERMRSARTGATQLRVIENPMLRSGLILTGANAVWSGDVPATGSNDGILTALEVSRLNLAGTELVTLSACETGLGDVRNGEGVFGLQRAFQVAGADCILMSLWKVADEPTAELMQSFYETWLSGKTKHEAFRTAREILRAKYQSPFVWAAFVMVGE